MKKFSLYDNIKNANDVDNEFLKDEKMLKEELKIDLNFQKDINIEFQYIVDEIYDHCLKELYYFSYSGIYNNLNFSVRSIILEKHLYFDSFFENLVKEHCVIICQMTIQNLLYGDYDISATNLHSYAKKNGHDSLINKYGIKNDTLNFKLMGSYNKSNNEICEELYIENKEDRGNVIKIKNRETLSDIALTFNKRKVSNDPMLSLYLSQCINIKITETRNKTKDNKEIIIKRPKIPLVLSNLSYCILMNLYNVEKLLINISNLKVDKDSEKIKKTEKIRRFNKNYSDFVNNINFDNDIIKILDYDFLKKLDKAPTEEEEEEAYLATRVYKYSTTKLDKYLFYYAKERLFNVDIINYFYALLQVQKFQVSSDYINYFKVCMQLPNALSRLNFLIDPNLISGTNVSQSIEIINKLISVTFPLFEKTFFITLYRYCEKNYKGNEIVEMNTILTEYVNNRMPDMGKTSTCEIDGAIKVLNNNQYKSKEHAYCIFEMLKHSFCNDNHSNKNINNNYHFTDDRTQNYFNMQSFKMYELNDPSTLANFNNYKIFNDYHNKILTDFLKPVKQNKEL